MDHQWSVDHQYLSTEGLSKRISGVSEPKLVTPGNIGKSIALKDRYKVHHSSHDSSFSGCVVFCFVLSNQWISDADFKPNTLLKIIPNWAG